MTITLEEVWRNRSDDQVIAAAQHSEEYSEAARVVIAAELARRQLEGTGVPPFEEPAALIESPHSRHLLARVWRGQLSLPMTYWVWGVLGNRVTFALVLAILSATTSAIVASTMLMAYASYFVFVAVAIWRSSARYAGPRVWRDLSRISLSLSTVRVLAEIFVS